MKNSYTYLFLAIALLGTVSATYAMEKAKDLTQSQSESIEAERQRLQAATNAMLEKINAPQKSWAVQIFLITNENAARDLSMYQQDLATANEEGLKQLALRIYPLQEKLVNLGEKFATPESATPQPPSTGSNNPKTNDLSKKILTGVGVTLGVGATVAALLALAYKYREKIKASYKTAKTAADKKFFRKTLNTVDDTIASLEQQQ